MPFLTVCLNPTLQKTLRFSSITPGAVNRTGDHRLDVSGKGINVTRVLTQLGKQALHLTQLGGVMRPLFLALCEQDGLSVEWLESGRPIRFCYTLLTGGDDKTTELVEDQAAANDGSMEQVERLLREKFDSILGDASMGIQCLIIAGTKAAGFSDAVFPYMTRRAKEKGLRVILDIKGRDLTESLQYGPDFIKPNLFEFAATFAPDLIKDNVFAINDDAVQERIKSMLIDTARKYGSRVILTNGSRKILAADGEKIFEIDVKPVKAVNSTGCGDAFTAGLAAALEDGAHFSAAIGEGIRCGALNAALVKPGVIRAR
jgi:fructose-1-phosphate kinase PfkB-like protein